jgi:hypothetical protein
MSMAADIRSFTQSGRPQAELAYGDERGWSYGCARKLGRGGAAPTDRLAEARRLAREACAHLQRALEESLELRASSGDAEDAGPNRAGAAREARKATAPLTAAQRLLARTGG